MIKLRLKIFLWGGEINGTSVKTVGDFSSGVFADEIF
jgi:hypothetical protein